MWLCNCNDCTTREIALTLKISFYIINTVIICPRVNIAKSVFQIEDHKLLYYADCLEIEVNLCVF